MVLFKIYYVSNGKTLTDKDQTFFRDVQNAAHAAFSSMATGMTVEEWNNSAFLYTEKAEAEKFLNKTVGTPSVVVLYRADDKDQFRAAYLKGVGKPAAWTTAFKKIFELVPIEVRETKGGDNDDGTNDDGDGNGSSDGKGGAGWLPFGSRECNVLDDLLANIGLEETLKKLFYGAGAVYLGSRALQSGNKTGQTLQGAGAAYMAYLALTATTSCGNAKKKSSESLKRGFVAGIGKVRFKSKFVPIYKNLAVPELGWKAETNIKWSQNKPGCYIIKRNGQTVYVGASANVYRKSLRHFEPYKPDKPGSKQDYHTDYEQNDYKIRIVVTNTVKQAYKLEAALIQKLQPRDNYIMEPHLDFTQREVDAALDEYQFFEVEVPF